MKIAEKAVIDSFTDHELQLQLLEMGCIPGESITLERIAPMGDPLAVRVSGFLLCIGLKEAEGVMVRDGSR